MDSEAGLSFDDIPLRDGGIGAKAYAEAVSVYLGLSIGRLANRSSSICFWDPTGQNVQQVFARQAIPMTWDFVEGNPFSNSSGNYVGQVRYLTKAMETLPAQPSGSANQEDARDVNYPDEFALSTDPPYYDNIGYADLSDFFYVWLRPAISPVYPEIMSILATPKSNELVATPYRHGGSENAERFFLEGMKTVMERANGSVSSEFPSTIYYAFKASEFQSEGVYSPGWATFIQAVIDSGFTLNGTWPIRTELTGNLKRRVNALANSVVLVCRKRAADAEVITRTDFTRALKRELPPAIGALRTANIAPADMPQSAIGPGMGIFSRHAAVLESDDSPMPVKTALQLINHELDAFLNDVQGEFDADTRFAITWFEQNGMATGDYGTANNLATARGLSVESVKHAGIVESRAGKVRILKRDELPDDWDPKTDTHLTVWECCQYLIRTLENDGEHQAAVLLRKIGADKADAAKELAYCLYDLCANKRGDANEATSYNALIAVWPDLTLQAARIHETDLDGDPQTAMNL